MNRRSPSHLSILTSQNSLFLSVLMIQSFVRCSGCNLALTQAICPSTSIFCTPWWADALQGLSQPYLETPGTESRAICMQNKHAVTDLWLFSCFNYRDRYFLEKDWMDHWVMETITSRENKNSYMLSRTFFWQITNIVLCLLCHFWFRLSFIITSITMIIDVSICMVFYISRAKQKRLVSWCDCR